MNSVSRIEADDRGGPNSKFAPKFLFARTQWIPRFFVVQHPTCCGSSFLPHCRRTTHSGTCVFYCILTDQLLCYVLFERCGLLCLFVDIRRIGWKGLEWNGLEFSRQQSYNCFPIQKERSLIVIMEALGRWQHQYSLLDYLFPCLASPAQQQYVAEGQKVVAAPSNYFLAMLQPKLGRVCNNLLRRRCSGESLLLGGDCGTMLLDNKSLEPVF